ncbi:hypothetical protein MT325_m582R [Paramecium bursaria chlorella virus MT325]|uniref:Uncharacterized protein m582R n=1 Tax=Paramecium bursaria Chlorella virus MT325 TaxID=346932 RepID=A7IUW2_PBCVM|nr:hypothetical protein MT325_m582R [Paramecium bursaria chlorella virus MT325]
MVVTFWQHAWYRRCYSTLDAFIIWILLRVVHWNHRVPYSIFHSGICISLDVSKQCRDISTVSISLDQKKGLVRGKGRAKMRYKFLVYCLYRFYQLLE